MAQTNLSPQTLNNIAPHLLSFLRDKVNTFVKWDLIRFFHDNPYAAETAENIAHSTGRDARTVETELDGLVDAGVLRQKTVSEFKIYMLASDAETRDIIQQFVAACDDRQFRIEAINFVIRGMQVATQRS